MKKYDKSVFIENFKKIMLDKFGVEAETVKYIIEPIYDSSKNESGEDSVFRLVLLSDENIGNKSIDFKHTTDILTAFDPMIPTKIEITNYKDSSEFKIKCSTRVRKPSAIANIEKEYAPFAVIEDAKYRDDLVIKPYWGLKTINLGMSFDETKLTLKKEQIAFRTEHWPNSDCTPNVAWNIIRIDDSISIFFANKTMFKIYFENSFTGALENGIKLGTPIQDAERIDPKLRCDYDEEIYVSKCGYWLETDPETSKVISMTVFIKEAESDETFYSYKWAE